MQKGRLQCYKAETRWITKLKTAVTTKAIKIKKVGSKSSKKS